LQTLGIHTQLQINGLAIFLLQLFLSSFYVYFPIYTCVVFVCRRAVQ